MNTKLISLAVCVFCILPAVAGSSHKGPRVQSRLTVTGNEVLTGPIFRGKYPATYSLGPGDSIGFTTYDYGTNGSARKTHVNFGDGTLALAEMSSMVLDPNTPDRGSWYSFSTDNGQTWPSLTKVEADRRGWANIDQFRDAGGVEGIISHDFGAFNLEFNVDAAKGAGVWSSTSGIGTSVWPRLAIGSAFNVHIVGSTGGNPPTGIGYSRSQDAGTTFDILDMPVFSSPGILPGADNYDIAAQGINVAIVSAASGADVALLTSSDNGDTWSEMVIYDVAGTGELPTGQEQFQPDGSCAVLFDNSGNIQVVWSNFLAIGDVNNDPVLYYSIDSPIMHWSASGGITNVAYPVPDTSIGTPLGRNGNLASQPDIGIDAEGLQFVTYSAMVNDHDSSGNYYEHVFGAAGPDGDGDWTGYDLTPGTGFDASFPSVADLDDFAVAHVMYYCDPFPGNFVQMNHDQVQVAVMYLQALTIIDDVGQQAGGIPQSTLLLPNYPNPFNPKTGIRYHLSAVSPVSLIVYDLLGREVATLVNETKAPGTYNVSWDASGQASGIYFYRLRAGSFVETKKMVVLK